jgi:hypothetical protein
MRQMHVVRMWSPHVTKVLLAQEKGSEKLKSGCSVKTSQEAARKPESSDAPVYTATDSGSRGPAQLGGQCGEMVVERREVEPVTESYWGDLYLLL